MKINIFCKGKNHKNHIVRAHSLTRLRYLVIFIYNQIKAERACSWSSFYYYSLLLFFECTQKTIPISIEIRHPIPTRKKNLKPVQKIAVKHTFYVQTSGCEWMTYFLSFSTPKLHTLRNCTFSRFAMDQKIIVLLDQQIVISSTSKF